MDNNYKNIAILGAGNWGTTLAVVLAERGLPVALWEYREDLAKAMRKARENSAFLPGIRIPKSVEVTSDLDRAVSGATVCLFAVPSQTLREVCLKAEPLLGPETLLVSAVKGLEHQTLLRMSQVVQQALGPAAERLAVLSGPNIAPEIARHMPSTSVAASAEAGAAIGVQELLMSKHLRVYTSDDVVGVELGGALKNVIAIASGIVDGLGLGANTKGALLTRGLAEITRLGAALGARPETFAGLSGLGDLVTTCVSPQSRNWRVGHAIGLGQRLDEILAGMAMVAEGVPTTESAFHLSEIHKVEMPITRAMYQVLFGGKEPRTAIGELMQREAKPEL